MRKRFTAKNALIGSIIAIFLVFAYSEIHYAKERDHSDSLVRSKKNERRMASIDGQELENILKLSAVARQPTGFSKFNVSKIYQQRMHQARERLRTSIKYRSGGYASRTLIEDIKLPEEWSLSPTLEKTLSDRKAHVKKVCHHYELDRKDVLHQPNAWEYLINEKYNLMWCPVFKAASSTWMFNFNLLSGYTESFLYGAKETPVDLARKKYPRLKTDQITEINNRVEKPLTFMITRHPYDRLVSAFRDKILGGHRYYRKLCREIITKYPQLNDGPSSKDIENIVDPLEKLRMRRRYNRVAIPSFRQFVQYLIDSIKINKEMDEHWTPMNKFCTPCLIDIDVFAKTETLDEDGNYIIFKSGIEHVIKPKRINRSKKGPTNDVLYKYLCQLSPEQQTDLADAFKLDLELFQYEYKPLFSNCSSVLIESNV